MLVILTHRWTLCSLQWVRCFRVYPSVLGIAYNDSPLLVRVGSATEQFVREVVLYIKVRLKLQSFMSFVQTICFTQHASVMVSSKYSDVLTALKTSAANKETVLYLVVVTL